MLQEAHKRSQQHERAHAGGHKGVQQEQQEGFVVQQTHTVGNPNTVVVHFEDTVVGDAVMVRPWRFPSLFKKVQL